MSYQLYDANGYVSDLASTKGLQGLLKYLKGLDKKEFKYFNMLGRGLWMPTGKDTIAEIDKLPAPSIESVKSTLSGLIDGVKRCKEIAVIGDGAHDDEASKASDNDEEYKDRYWKAIDTRRNAYYGILQKRFKPLYDKMGKSLANGVEKGEITKSKESIKKAVLAHSDDWEKTMTAVYMVLIEDFGKVKTEQMQADSGGLEIKAFDPFSSAVRDWIAKNAAFSVKTILDTQIIAAHGIITKGVDDGLTNAQIAKELRDFFDMNSEYMSMRIARTETAKASGYAQREAAIEGGANEKEWVSSRDDRVRGSDAGDTADHIKMDGETKDIDDPYSNGLMFPGDDSTGDLDEFINCRCVEKHRRAR